jgi:hypothetical protein
MGLVKCLFSQYQPHIGSFFSRFPVIGDCLAGKFFQRIWSDVKAISKRYQSEDQNRQKTQPKASLSR